MAYGIVIRFEGVTEAEYLAVNRELGMPSGDWPSGLRTHVGGPTPGGWLVIELWDSKAEQEAFMSTRLGPALGKVGVAPPAQVLDTETVLTMPD